MVRIFSRHNSVVQGPDWHIVANGRNMREAVKELSRRWETCASHGRDLYFDRGFGTDLKRLAPTF